MPKPSYDLRQLKFPDFVLPPPPEAGAAVDLRVKRLTFRIAGPEATTIAVETDVSKDPHALDIAVQRVFGDRPGQYALVEAEVVGVTYQATIDRGDGAKPRTRTFDISEGSTSLRYDEMDLVLRRMLIDGGIDQTAGRVGQETAPARPEPQRAAG